EARRQLALARREGILPLLDLLFRRARRIEARFRRTRRDAREEGRVVVQARPRPLFQHEQVQPRPSEGRRVLREAEQERLVSAPDLAQVQGVHQPGRLQDPRQRRTLARRQSGQGSAHFGRRETGRHPLQGSGIGRNREHQGGEDHDARVPDRYTGCMRFGIDFGTTHTVVATIDRGNYPVVSFEHADVIPSIVSADPDGELHFGRAKPGWTVLRSFKRLLDEGHPDTEVRIGKRVLPLSELLTRFLSHVRDQILHHSNAGLRKKDKIEAAVSVPANASTAQRLITMDAYRRAGFDVKAVLNEPSAAGFEYAHRYRDTLTSKREYVLVYDLGGGTFDASLIHMEGRTNEVITSAGISRLGGDDFDEVIAELILAKRGG